MKFLTVILLTLVIRVSVFGQSDPDEHIIDRQLRACLDSTENGTTLGMIDCAFRAGEQWEKELNKNYDLLISELSFDEKEKLKGAQKNWMSYREKEMEFARTMYVNLQGTMWRIVLAERMTQLTKQRALELKEYYNNLQ